MQRTVLDCRCCLLCRDWISRQRCLVVPSPFGICDNYKFCTEESALPKLPKGTCADIRIECAQCEKQFRFLGLPGGVDINGASVSVSGTEARLAIAPVDEPVQRTAVGGFTVKETND